MFESLVDKKNILEFEYAKIKVKIWNSNLIDFILGKNKQNPVNACSSNWKKEINRYSGNEKQTSINPKYLELQNLFQNSLNLKNKFLDLNEFREQNILNLNNFKNNLEYRKNFLNKYFKDFSTFEIKNKVQIDETYILLSLYIIYNYNFLKKEDSDSKIYYDELKIKDLNNFYKKIEEIFNSDIKIHNLNSLCYNLYFWIDIKLVHFNDCSLHTIVWDLVSNLVKNYGSELSQNSIITSNGLSFNQDTGSIGSLLAPEDNIFKIPPYQREYSWSLVEVKQFFADFLSVYKNKNSSKMYFIGTLIFRKVDKETSKTGTDYLEIIDGQQRLTTILILIRVLIDYSGDTSRNSYLRFKELGSTEEVNKLELNKNNKDFFLNLILTKDNNYRNSIKREDISNTSNKRLYDAYYSLKNSLKQELNLTNFNEEKRKQYYEDLLGTLLKTFTITTMTVSNIKTANLIFEVLNTRGKSLLNFEILKSYILAKYEGDVEVLASFWHDMINKFGDSFEEYLMAVLTSMYEKSYNEYRSKGFLKYFGEKMIEEDDYFSFSIKVFDEVKIYTNLISVNQEIFPKEKTREKIHLINILKYNSVHKALLSAYLRDEDKTIFLQVLNLVLRAIFKNKFSEDKPGILNTFITKLSYNLRNNQINFSELYKENVLIFDLEMMKNNFLLSSIYKRKSESLKILKILNNTYFEGLSVEHILEESQEDYEKRVQKIEKEAKEMGDEDFKFNQNAIYNLTLLTQKDNRNLSNKILSEKIGTYSKYSKENTIYCVTTEFISKVENNFSYKDICEYKNFLWELAKKRFNL